MIVQSIPYPASAGGGGGHRYWRINQTTNHGNASTQFIEVEMRETPGGSDVTGSGTASGGGGFTGSTPANAFDNTLGAAYVPTGASGWLKYDFGLGNAKNIVEVAIKAASATGSQTNFAAAPKDFTIEWSDDDSAWTQLGSACALYGPILDHYHVFPETVPAAGFHRFWRILCTTANGGTFYLIDEIEFRATSGAADQVPVQSGANGDSGGRSIMGAGSNAWNAFDGTTAAWSSSGTTNQWVGFIFPTAVKVEEILLRATANTSRTVNTGAIEYSDDQVTWTSQKALTGLTWTASEAKVLAAI
jgi:hypothetical protein